MMIDSGYQLHSSGSHSISLVQVDGHTVLAGITIVIDLVGTKQIAHGALSSCNCCNGFPGIPL